MKTFVGKLPGLQKQQAALGLRAYTLPSLRARLRSVR